MVSKYLYSGETLNESLTKLKGKNIKHVLITKIDFLNLWINQHLIFFVEFHFFAHWHLGRNLNWKTKWNKYTKENDQFNKGLN